MKIDDQMLTAYALGELSAEDSRAVKKAIDADKELAKEVQAIEEVAALISNGYKSEDMKLSAEQRGKIFAAGNAPTNIEDFNSLKERSSWKTWTTVGIGLAAAVAVLFTFVQNETPATEKINYANFTYKEMSAAFQAGNQAWDGDADNTSADTTTAASSKTKSVAQAAQSEPQTFKEELKKKILATPEADKPEGEFTESNWVQNADRSSANIPLVAGNTSWQWIQSAFETDQPILPVLVRTEEIINQFQIPFSADFQLNSLNASVELMKSPWNENTLVAVVQLKNSGDKAIADVAAGMEFEPSVERFRVVGYRDQKAGGIAAINKINMQQGYTHTVIYELELKQDEQRDADKPVIKLHLQAGKDAKSLSYNYAEQTLAEASLSARLPVIVAHWAQTVAKSPNVMSDQSTLKKELKATIEPLKDSAHTKSLQKMLDSLN